MSKIQKYNFERFFEREEYRSLMMRPPTNLETLKCALENYQKRHRANLLEMLLAREYVVYMKYKHRMKQSMRETYLERIAQIIAEAMETTFSKLELKTHFDKLTDLSRVVLLQRLGPSLIL